MVTVLLGAIVSIGIALFAMSVILREFQGRWHQMSAALAFDERAFISNFGGGELTPLAVRPARLAPARSRPQPRQRAAA